MRILITATYCAIIFNLTACSDHSTRLKSQQNSTIKNEMSGLYQAYLRPVNISVAGPITGSLTLLKQRGELITHLRFSGGPASTMHVQNIHIGNRCPLPGDDLNHDNLIDAVEGEKIFKDVILPLDDDLNSQWMGGGTFPVSDLYGDYFYSRIASWEKLMLDLLEEDINSTDNFVKLSENQSLNLEGQIVVILGVPDTTELPISVQGRGRLSKHQSLPIACGLITRVTHTPGQIDTGVTDIPVPINGAVSGSGGMDDGASFSSSAQTQSTGIDYGNDENNTHETSLDIE